MSCSICLFAVPVWKRREASEKFRSMKTRELRKWLGQIGLGTYDKMFKDTKTKGISIAGIRDYREFAAKEKVKSVQSDSESSDSEEEPELNITNSVHAKRLLVKFYEDQEEASLS